MGRTRKALGLDIALIAAIAGLANPTMQAQGTEQRKQNILHDLKHPPKNVKPTVAQPYTDMNRQQRKALQAQQNKAMLSAAKAKSK